MPEYSVLKPLESKLLCFMMGASGSLCAILPICISLWGHRNVCKYTCINAEVCKFTGIYSPVKPLPLWRPRVIILVCNYQGALKTIGRTFDYGISEFLCSCPRRGIHVQVNSLTFEWGFRQYVTMVTCLFITSLDPVKAFSPQPAFTVTHIS